MRKLIFWLVFFAFIGTYLHYVRGWDLARLRAETIGKIPISFLQGPKPPSGPIGTRGTGTHWETAAPMGESRSQVGAVLIEGKIYVVGGIDGYGRTVRTVEIYDIEKDEWSLGTQIPQAVHHAAVATDGERLFVFGGFQGIGNHPVDDVYAYHPGGRTWIELNRLNDFRGGGVGAYLADRVHFVGGRNQAGPTGVVETYDTAQDRWDTIATMPTPREHLTAAVLGGKLYALGGRQGGLDYNLDTVEAYDPTRGKWDTHAPMPHKRGGIASAPLGGLLYVFGGESKEGTFADIDVYDPAKNQWKSYGLSLPTPRHGLAAIPYKNRIYVIGGGKRTGFSVSNVNEVLILDGKLLGWSETEQLELMK